MMHEQRKVVDMTEATEAKKNEVNPLDIPWFLDAKNPENIERRAKLKVRRSLPPPAKLVSVPAKSIATMPTAKPEQDTKPIKVVNALAPKPVAAPKKGKMNTDAVIRVLVSEFGHKAGSKAETKSAGLKDGMTVAEYMADDLGISGKWHTSHINHCLGKNFIKLES